jgi:site-specific DNA-cytosine methylase
VYSDKGCCPTLTLGVPPKILIEDDGEYKVRELSGREGLMLMGVEKDDVAMVAASGLSDAQMMKLGGNSIVVSVMSSFFKELVQC